jgi:hypothetical protein
MAWFYTIRDQQNVVVKTAGGYKTEMDAMTAGRADARTLKAAGAIPSGGLGTLTTGQNSELPTR